MTRRPLLSAPLIALMCIAGAGHFVVGTDPDSVMPWVRLPFQTVLIAWALLIAREPA